MPLAQMLIVYVPPQFLLGIFVLLSIALSFLGLIITRKIISHERLLIHNDVVGPIFSTVGVIYAVILAFVVIVTWQNFDRVNLGVEKEASCLASLYSDSDAFEQHQQLKIRGLLRDYAKAIVKDEWPKMSFGSSSSLAADKMHEIRNFYSSMLPNGRTQDIYLQESVSKLNELLDYRNVRLLNAKEGVHPILWFTLISGAVITMLISFLFGTKNFDTQKVMTILLAAIIAFILFTVLELDYPFSGTNSIKPDAFIRLIEFNR